MGWSDRIPYLCARNYALKVWCLPFPLCRILEVEFKQRQHITVLMKPTIVTALLYPYAWRDSHIGHLAGAYPSVWYFTSASCACAAKMSSTISADRMSTVVPITLRIAARKGRYYHPQQVVDKCHAMIKKSLKMPEFHSASIIARLEKIHEQTASDFFKTLSLAIKRLCTSEEKLD